MRPVAAALSLSAVLWAQPGWAASSERAELKRERQAIEADYAKREQECRKQFVVTPCIEKVRREKNEALSTVKAREGAIDSAERLERAEAQKQRLADKAAASAARAASEPASAASTAKSRPAPTPRKHEAKPAPDAAGRKSKEDANRADYEARQREIRAHRAEVEKRNAEKAAKRQRPPQPLPVPASG